MHYLESLKREDAIGECPKDRVFDGPTYSHDAATIHRIAKRNALLRRGLYPGSPRWNAETFADRRDGSEVPDNDLKRILAQPKRYEPYVPFNQDCRLIQRLPQVYTPPTAEEFIGRGLVHHAVVNLGYGTLISGTGGITSLATSSTWLAGYEWYVVDNTAAAQAGLQLDWFHSGAAMVGTTPTATTEIRYYLIGSPDGTYWPDVFDGTPSAETVTSAGVFSGFGKLACVTQVGATTSNVAYQFAFGTRQWFDFTMPKKFVVFVTHNTAVNLNATGGNHLYYAQPEYVTVI